MKLKQIALALRRPVSSSTSNLARYPVTCISCLQGGDWQTKRSQERVCTTERFPNSSPQKHYRSFSASASSYQSKQDVGNEESIPETDDATISFSSAMRNMVKPFLLKVHPDVQESESAKEINLIAIQNLNSFLDSAKMRLKPAARPTRDDKTLFEVDFCILMEERVDGKKTELLCRRKVELTLPTKTNQRRSDTTIRELEAHVGNQLVKLLHIAGLKIPKSSAFQHPSHFEEDFETKWQKAVKSGDFSNLTPAQVARARQEKWKRSRDEFTARINWKRFQEVYDQTLKDLQANRLTEGLIRDDPRRKMTYLSEILSRVRVENEEEVDPILQIIALRRISMILDDNFDELYLEELGRLWESTVIVLTAARDYNTSPSALYRRRKRKVKKGDIMANDGFAFTLHHDNSVTIHIPVDFRDEEIISQLKRHTSDYHSLIGIGIDDYFPR